MSKSSNENYKTLLKETKGDLSKLRSRLFLTNWKITYC